MTERKMASVFMKSREWLILLLLESFVLFVSGIDGLWCLAKLSAGAWEKSAEERCGSFIPGAQR
jgi:hypothetical protein